MTERTYELVNIVAFGLIVACIIVLHACVWQ